MSTGPAGSAAISLHPALAALEASGADRFNPVRFRYIKAMAERSLQVHETVAGLVAKKALAALQQYQSELSREQAEASVLVERIAAQRPESAQRIRALFAAGDFRAVKRLAARWQRAPAQEALTDLLHRLNRPEATAEQNPEGGPGGELRAASYFRDALQQHHADRLVSRAEREAPADSGPLNPQKLAIRSLSTMRELSPRYLASFVSYVDTLFWLEKAGESSKP
jgi:hypothetical protein